MLYDRDVHMRWTKERGWHWMAFGMAWLDGYDGTSSLLCCTTLWSSQAMTPKPTCPAPPSTRDPLSTPMGWNCCSSFVSSLDPRRIFAPRPTEGPPPEISSSQRCPPTPCLCNFSDSRTKAPSANLTVQSLPCRRSDQPSNHPCLCGYWPKLKISLHSTSRRGEGQLT